MIMIVSDRELKQAILNRNDKLIYKYCSYYITAKLDTLPLTEDEQFSIVTAAIKDCMTNYKKFNPILPWTRAIPFITKISNRAIDKQIWG